MTAERKSTIDKLMELFHKSRERGESVYLSLDSKNRKDTITFAINGPSGTPEGQGSAWPPSTILPWSCRQPRPWTPTRRRKSPSQWRRGENRKEEFLAKKAALVSAEVKKESNDEPAVKKVTIVEPED